MLSSVSVGFFLLVKKGNSLRSEPIANFLTIPGLFAAYLSTIEDISCCSLQGGYGIIVDSEPWNGDMTEMAIEYSSSIDEFWMTIMWLEALIQIHKGKSRADVHFWEQSQGLLTRDGNKLTIQDGDSFPAFNVNSQEFTQQMLDATKPYLYFIDSIDAELKDFKEEEKAHIISLMLPDEFHAKYDESQSLIKK